MNKHPYRFYGRKTLRTLSIVLGSMTVAFVVGIESAGDIKPVISSTNAVDAVTLGDFDGNGTLDTADVLIALDIVSGKRNPTASELLMDPSQDFHITLEDVQSMLLKIKQQQ